MVIFHHGDAAEDKGEEARMIRREDVGNAVGVPENLGAFFGDGCSPRAGAGGKQGERNDESDPGANGEPAGELKHSFPLCGALYTPLDARGQA